MGAVENPRSVEHLHPGMEERPGTVVTVPADVVHLAWNPPAGAVRLRIEMRPALRWRELTTRFFAGEAPVGPLAEFAAEVRLPPPEG